MEEQQQKEEENPCVLVVSYSNTKPKSLIQLITKEKISECEGDVVKHPWRLNTKYYKADIDFMGITNDFERGDDNDTFFNDRNIEALILHFDSNKANGLDELKEWENVENPPDIKLLIANYCDEATKIGKDEAMNWCLKHSFELIELYPNVSIIDECEEEQQDIIPEKYGAERIVECLQAHVWSNLVMKNGKDELEGNVFDNSEQFGDDFSELFDKLHVMKESIQSLPMKERKHCAEQVVMAFWKAIGGDEDEITDL